MSHGGFIAHCLELMRPWGRLAMQAVVTARSAPGRRKPKSRQPH